MKKLFVFFLFLLSAEAHSAAWTSDFTITNIYVAGENNFGYRVYGMPAMPSCPNGTNWAYVNKVDSGSQGFATSIFTAFTTGRPVRLLVEPANGFCHILEVFLTA